MTITARQLDGDGSIVIREATNGSNGSDNYRWDAMLVGMQFHSAGCWQVTGQYEGHELDVVLKVGATGLGLMASSHVWR
ncbi:MAG: hypothetical protein WD002_11980 [Pseudomonadales bacterium]